MEFDRSKGQRGKQESERGNPANPAMAKRNREKQRGQEREEIQAGKIAQFTCQPGGIGSLEKEVIQQEYANAEATEGVFQAGEISLKGWAKILHRNANPI